MIKKRYVIGVGNPDRGDDIAGRLVARKLRDQTIDLFEVVEHNGEVGVLLDYLEQAQTAIIIDAATSGAAPGTIYRFDAHDGPLPQNLLGLSTHGFGPAEAIELARAMNVLPEVCVICTVEGSDFEAGHKPTKSVVDAINTLTTMIVDEMESLLPSSYSSAIKKDCAINTGEI